MHSSFITIESKSSYLVSICENFCKAAIPISTTIMVEIRVYESEVSDIQAKVKMQLTAPIVSPLSVQSHDAAQHFGDDIFLII